MSIQSASCTPSSTSFFWARNTRHIFQFSPNGACFACPTTRRAHSLLLQYYLEAHFCLILVNAWGLLKTATGSRAKCVRQSNASQTEHLLTSAPGDQFHPAGGPRLRPGSRWHPSMRLRELICPHIHNPPPPPPFPSAFFCKRVILPSSGPGSMHRPVYRRGLQSDLELRDGWTPRSSLGRITISSGL